MIIKRIIPLAILCALLWVVSSCLEDIDLDTGERILSVYCVLRNSPEQELELSYIAPIGGSSSPVGEGVTISLYDGEAPVGEFTRASETRWNLDYTPQSGHTYRLEVKVPGEETLTAETRYPPIGKLHYVEAVIPGYGTGWLPADIGLVDGTVKPGLVVWGYEMESSEDLILWCYAENLDDGPLVSGYIASDHPGVDGRGETSYPLDTESPVYQSRFKFGSSLHYPRGELVPPVFFGGPPFLHEKVLRIMHPAGFSRPVDNEKLRVFHYNQEMTDALGIPIPIEDKSGKTGLFCLATVDAPERYVWVFNSVSAEYDKYMADYYFTRHASYDFTTLVYRKNHYSNILNGTGIFGAYYKYRFFPRSYFYDL